MKVKKIIAPAIAIYILAMVIFWFHGKGTSEWNVFYYSIEKLFAMIGFSLLALESKNRYVAGLSLYAASICLFMFIYFIYCMYFGHDSKFAMGALVLYSGASLLTIKNSL